LIPHTRAASRTLYVWRIFVWKMTWLGYSSALFSCKREETYSLFGRRDSGEMNDCIDTLEERILLSKLGYDLSVVGQIGSNEFRGDISLGGYRGHLIDCTC
jgi:hypothetical protein